jgi:hypothetical protein
MGLDEVQIEYLQSLDLFIGIPCFKTIHTEFHKCCLELQKLFIEAGVKHEFVHWHGSLITWSRNEMANYFIRHPSNYTHYISLDSDLIFKAEDIIRLLFHREEFVGAQYPWKTLLHDRKPRAYEVSSLEPCLGYPVNPIGGTDPRKAHEFDKWHKGLVAVSTITTGFQVLQRSVFEKMITYYDTLGTARTYDSGNGAPHYDFFGNRPTGDGDGYLHEDTAFCHDYAEAGGTVYLDLMINVGHEGTFVYDGMLMERLHRGEPIKPGWFVIDRDWKPHYPGKEGSSTG